MKINLQDSLVHQCPLNDLEAQEANKKMKGKFLMKISHFMTFQHCHATPCFPFFPRRPRSPLSPLSHPQLVEFWASDKDVMPGGPFLSNQKDMMMEMKKNQYISVNDYWGINQWTFIQFILCGIVIHLGLLVHLSGHSHPFSFVIYFRCWWGLELREKIFRVSIEL